MKAIIVTFSGNSGYNELNKVTSDIHRILENRKFFNNNEIGSITSIYNWSYDYSRHRFLSHENQSIENIQHDHLKFVNIQEEIELIEKLLDSRNKLLDCIDITPTTN